MKQQPQVDKSSLQTIPLLDKKYYLAEAQNKPAACFAHVTNQMGMIENDFEKGESDGNKALTGLLARVARAWREGM